MRAPLRRARPRAMPQRPSIGPDPALAPLLQALAAEVDERDELEELELVTVSCSELGTNDPLQPFVEILRKLTERDRRRTKAKRVLEVVGEVAPAVLGLIPGLGTAGAVVVR